MTKRTGQFRHYEPLPLLRNVRYPTYQLYAVAGTGKTSLENVLTIAVLETMHWLRRRFREFEIPSELKWPEASSYDQVDCGDFTSFFIHESYKVEVIWLPEERIWTLQLIEPDLGPSPDSEKQSRPPVPGRIFETNVAYRITTDKVECGFCTLVSEPVGTTQPCEVYRLALIKHLARNPLVGLRQGCWSLKDEAHCLNGPGPIKAFQSWLKDEERMMPAVVFAEYKDNYGKAIPVLAKANPLVYNPPVLLDIEELHPAGCYKTNLIKKLKPELVYREENEISSYISELTRYRMGYAQFFTLPCEHLETFYTTTGENLRPGDVLVFEPAAFGGKVISYPYYYIKETPAFVFREIENYIQNYPKKKTMSFGKVVFLPEAKEIHGAKLLDLNRSKEEILYGFEKKLEAVRGKHEDELREKDELHAIREEELNQKIERQSEQIEGLKKLNASLREDIRSLREKHLMELAAKDREIERLQALLERPERPCDVADWVERHFAGKLIFHQRARDKMEAVAPGKVDMPLLCNALEFLAVDYRDFLVGLIDDEEMYDRCTRKYGRPFEVVSVGEVSPKRYPGEYKIKYFIGRKGKPVESLLNYHLRVGNDNERLLRIYFLFDREKKLIVVGSLPEHLPTVSFK